MNTDFHFYYPLEVRYGDLDPQGHVNNAAYLTYFEHGRIHYLIHLGLFQKGQSFLDIGIIVATAQITFKAPIHFGQPVRAGVAVTRLGNKSLTMRYRLEHAETQTVFAEGETVLVTFDYHSGQTVPIPENWRQIIAAYENIPPQSA